MISFFSKESENMIFQDISDKFNSSPLNTRNCVKSINSFLYFLSNNKMDQDILNNILIFLLRSFQSKESYLKHIVYSVLIEISKYTDQGFIGINIILKDLNNSKFKQKILKSLFCIIPEEMINDFTKTLKEAFLSNDEKLVNSATLVTYLLLNKNFIKSKDLYKNLKISNDIYGYQSLALLNLNNKITDEKYFSFKNEAGIASVRLAIKYKKYDLFKNFLNLRISDTFVFFEACHQLSNLKEEYSIQFIPLICQGLRSFLKNGNLYEKFFSIKILSNFSTKFSSKISILNQEIEESIQDTNKSLSMLAISILLKTGTEETIDRLIKYLPDFMSEMDDNYKKIGLNALYILTLKNIKKMDIFLEFVKRCILEKGNLSFKLFIVNLLKDLMFNKEFVSNKQILIDDVLEIYAIYLEDSEYYEVSSEILGIMSKVIYRSKNYKKYLLHIYNRLILEESKLKNAALQAIYDLSKNIKIDKSIFYDCEDSIVNDFYINHIHLQGNDYNISSEGMLNDNNLNASITSEGIFNNVSNANISNNVSNNLLNASIANENISKNILNEDIFNNLGDLKDSVNKYLKDYDLIKEDIKEEKVKECREILLTKETDEVSIKLIKKIKGTKIILEYKIENKYEDIEIKNGIINIKIKENTTKLPFKNLLPGDSKIVNLEIDSFPDLSIYGNLDFEICVVDDYSEVDTESLPLLPYQITYFDLMKNVETEKGSFNKLIKFNLKSSLVEGTKKILDMINLKVILQNNYKNKNEIHFCGIFENINTFIECDIEYDKVCRCRIEIWSDSEEVVEKLGRYFE